MRSLSNIQSKSGTGTVNSLEISSRNLLFLIDSHSKWIEVKLMSSTTIAKTTEVLRGIFASYGLPKELVSDTVNPLYLASIIFSVFMPQVN